MESLTLGEVLESNNRNANNLRRNQSCTEPPPISHQLVPTTITEITKPYPAKDPHASLNICVSDQNTIKYKHKLLIFLLNVFLV